MEELGQVADFYAGTTLPDGQPFQGQTTGVFLVKVSDMNLPGNEGELRSCRLWSPAPGVKAATCPKDTIVIPKRGGAIGTNKKRLTVRRSVLDPNLMGIAARPAALTVPFLLQWFHGFDLASITSGSSVPQLNKKDLAPLRIVVPPLSLQHEFSCRMSAVERVKEAHRASLAKLDALFASLQHRAFRGEL
jgi:type I restriction enzyme S subunit